MINDVQVIYVPVHDNEWGLFFRWFLIVTLSSTMSFFAGLKLGRSKEI